MPAGARRAPHALRGLCIESDLPLCPPTSKGLCLAAVVQIALHDRPQEQSKSGAVAWNERRAFYCAARHISCILQCLWLALGEGNRAWPVSVPRCTDTCVLRHQSTCVRGTATCVEQASTADCPLACSRGFALALMPMRPVPVICTTHAQCATCLCVSLCGVPRPGRRDRAILRTKPGRHIVLRCPQSLSALRCLAWTEGSEQGTSSQQGTELPTYNFSYRWSCVLSVLHFGNENEQYASIHAVTRQ